MRERGDLIGMYKVMRGLGEIEWTKSPLLRTDIELTCPAQRVRVNHLRLRREAFNSRSVTQRHNFFTFQHELLLYHLLMTIAH